jgi:hypothetical protein
MTTAMRSKPKAQPETLAAFQSPAFRLYFVGQLVSVSGTWMQAVAQQVLVYELTKSELALGVVACAQGLPAVFLMPIAGVIVERFPRRRLIVMTQFALMLLALILAALQFSGQTQIWHIALLALGVGTANALDAPARQSFVVEMVGRERLVSGLVLQAIMFNTARIIGPALGGIALKAVGPAWCFLLNGLSFLAVLLSLILMIVPFPQPNAFSRSIWEPLLEGFNYARRHPLIRPLLLLAAVNSMFGVTFSVLLPSFADQVLHDTSGGTAALLTAQGFGAITAGFAVTRVRSSGHAGKFLLAYPVIGTLAVYAFVLSRSLVPAIISVALAGLFLIGMFITMNTAIQSLVDDTFRGRVVSLYTLTFFGLNPFASLAIGSIAEAFGNRSARGAMNALYLATNNALNSSASVLPNLNLGISPAGMGTLQAIALYSTISLMLTLLIFVTNRNLIGMK